MQWKIKTRIKKNKLPERRKEIIKALLENRGITLKRKQEEFFHPKNPHLITPEEVGLDSDQLHRAISRIKIAIEKKQLIVIYGDYDADGICATAILWEILHNLKANVLPFIPQREQHGYGLSVNGIDTIIKEMNEDGIENVSLFITVDNGIVAYEAVDYANSKNCDVIICDHHQKTSKLPKAYAIVHSNRLAGVGVAWIFAKEIIKKIKSSKSSSKILQSTLDLLTIGTVADMVPLLGLNRIIVKHGLNSLRSTRRVGLLKLFEEAALKPDQINTYHINFLIAPRLNSMGRLENAFDSLRLICTKRYARASLLAKKIQSTNLKRQRLTQEMLEMAKSLYLSEKSKAKTEKIIIVDHQEFHEGVIGLIAGKLVEEFNLPTIVLARGKQYAKASARSVNGFNIIEAIRKTESLLIDVGGHPMAAGFTVKASNIKIFKRKMKEIVDLDLSDEVLQKKLTVECELELPDLGWKLYQEIKKFQPFGIGNPQPVFALSNVRILEAMTVGGEGQHLKLLLPASTPSQSTLPAIWFGHGESLNVISKISSLAFVIDENFWRKKRELQLIIKDVN